MTLVDDAPVLDPAEPIARVLGHHGLGRGYWRYSPLTPKAETQASATPLFALPAGSRWTAAEVDGTALG
ncbi:hypothetical protein [Streptomyces sp. NBC_01602]|uniref:hypothetical protein n=1 Tax=Streptomyces sp. NBC_01602 TaxID=2975893 RepID=UPI003868A29C